MGNISSINIKKTNAIQPKHNARDEDFKPSYLLKSGGKGFECNRSSLEAESLRNRMIKEAQERYKQRTGQKFQAKSYLASAVINLKADSTMQDVERVAEHLQKKHKFQCYQIAIHRDEGHIDENGKECINHHAHLEFVTLDKETGRNMWQTKHIGIGKLRELQDEVAQILQMERGVDKRLSGAKRVEPRKYAVMKEQEKQQRKAQITQNLTPKEISEVCENFRKSKKNLGYPKEFFRELSAIKKDTKESSKQELEILLEDLAKNYELQRQINQNLQEQQDKETQEIAYYQNYKRETYSIYEENKALKQENYSLKNEIDTQTKQINLLKQENTELKELFSIAMQKFWAQLITISARIKEYFKEDLTNYAKRLTPSIQTFLQDTFKSTEAKTQAPHNTTAPKSLSDIPQPRVSRVKEILAGGVSKAQESAQQGQSNATTQPNIQPTYKPKPRKR